MEIIEKLINEIQQSKSKGQELIIDSYLVGYLIGTGQIKSIKKVKNLIKKLQIINNQMNKGEISSFSRDYFISQKLMRSRVFSQDSSQLVQEEKQQINHDDNVQNTQKSEDELKKQQNKQQIMQTVPIDQKFQQQLQYSSKYNTLMNKLVHDSEHNQKQN